LSKYEDKLSNKEFNEILYKRDKKDEEDLLAEVDKAGILGYKLPNTGDPNCIRFLLASYRLCSRFVLIERQPYVLIRKNSENGKQ